MTNRKRKRERAEECHFCEKTLACKWQTVCVDDDGQEYKGWVTTEPYTLANTTIGEINICAACYPLRAAASLSDQDMAEVHYQYGLETEQQNPSGLSESAKRQSTKACFLLAFSLNRKADYLAALASVSDSQEESDRLNREALILDPDCLIAQLNLYRIEPDDHNCPLCKSERADAPGKLGG